MGETSGDLNVPKNVAEKRTFGVCLSIGINGYIRLQATSTGENGPQGVETMRDVLWTVAAISALLWLFGMVTALTLDEWIHLIGGAAVVFALMGWMAGAEEKEATR